MDWCKKEEKLLVSKLEAVEEFCAERRCSASCACDHSLRASLHEMEEFYTDLELEEYLLLSQREERASQARRRERACSYKRKVSF